ncbi:MAG: molybdopterin-dependent oxidoreductase, partial [Thermoleophilia bacterium]|nr:molybdopterin-dependent oxidoreductase [Thermoleophilia bacterium]
MQHVSPEISPGCFAAPLASLGRDTVPTGEHFVRSHFGVPQLDADLHAVEITGLVKRSVRWTLNDFRKLSLISTHVTLECAGHRRMELDPSAPGVPWQLGAVSHARWAGAQLADLFEIVRPLPEATHIVLTGADAGDVEGRTDPEAFARAIPLRDPGVREIILAGSMNGKGGTP